MSKRVRRYFLVALLLGGIFFAGVIVGGASGVIITALGLRQAVRTSADPDRWPGIAMKRLGRELTLTEEQQQRIEPIVERASTEVRDIYAVAILEGMEVLQEAREEIELELTEEQQARFKEFVESRRGRFRRFLGDQTAERLKSSVEESRDEESDEAGDQTPAQPEESVQAEGEQ